ncbi:MAG: DUF1570 domain-containing protein [Phycisphaerae bacterium]|nr:DUF1570 domain-containing protein [Phycisphaerae bacterium]
MSLSGVWVRVLIVWTTALMSAGSARAGERLSFDSRNYRVTTTLDRREAESLASHMDAVFEEYARRFASFKVRNRSRADLYLFRSMDEYNRFLADAGYDGRNTAGMFYSGRSGTGLAAFVQGQTRAELLHTLQHEGFHQFAFMRIGAALPPWANEGLAEWFGQAKIVRGSLVTGLAEARRVAAVKKRVTEGKAWGFGELLGMSNDRWNARVNAGDARAGLLYDQSWSIVQFIIHGESGKYEPLLTGYLHALADGKGPDAALRAAFGDDLAEFERAWRAFIDGLRPDPLSTAADRLDFYAQGLRGLRTKGKDPASFDELRRTLTDAGFRLARRAHGVREEVSASDPGMFDPPPADDPVRKTSWEFTAGKDGAPPGVRTRGLKVDVRLAWVKRTDPTGRDIAWDPEIRFE